HYLSLSLVDDELAVFDVIAERGQPAHPHPLPFGGGDLVADPFASDFALELREGEQDVEGKPPHAARCVEGLSDGNERDALGVEGLNDLGEIGERSGEPVDLVDDNHIDPSFANAIEQTLQRRTIGGSAGIAAVVEALAHESPAFMSLALDIGLGRFSLRVEGVEVLLKTRVA